MELAFGYLEVFLGSLLVLYCTGSDVPLNQAISKPQQLALYLGIVICANLIAIRYKINSRK